jgi:serine/threonine-protein kinase
MTFRERLQWLFRLALMLFILASVAFLSALTAMRFAVQGREVSVPDVTSKNVNDARSILQGRRLGMEVEDRVYNTLPQDSVVRQSPPANMRVKVGQVAHVVLSLGPQKATVPQLVGTSLRAAQIELLRGQIQGGEISSVYLPDGPAETVVQQDPAAGQTDVTSSHLNMLVSLGARPPVYLMPEVTGLPIGEAQARLSSAGLKVTVAYTPAPLGELPGAVTGQTPSRGQPLDANAPVRLQVSK